MDWLRCIFVVAVAFSVPKIAFADLPLTVEDLIVDKGTFKLEISLSYANSDIKSLLAGEPIIIQTGDASFVTVPTRFGELKGNADAIVTTFGLHYGVGRSSEVYMRTSFLYKSIRSSGFSGSHKSNESGLVDSWLGLNYQFLEDSNTPALIGFAEGVLNDNYQDGNSFGKSWMLGLTSYRAIDPVVLSITTAYKWSQKFSDGVQPGNYFLISPSVAFAVNDQVTLISGIQWLNRQADRYDDTIQGFRQTRTDVTIGLGYGVSKGNILNFSFKANASGNHGADLRINWVYTI